MDKDADCFGGTTLGKPLVGGDRIRFGVLGNSITAGSSATLWPFVVATNYSGGGHLVNNYAASGGTVITDADGDDDMAAQAANSAGDDNNFVIIALGTNDDNAGNMTTLQAAYESGIIDLKTNNPNATIYALNVLPRWTDNTTGPEVDKSNIRTAIAAACTSQGITCWDTYTTPWILQSDTSDGIHPTAAGHTKIATEVLARL